MRVPAHIRFTLPELIAFGLQSAEVLARANSAIHLVLTEQQEGLPSSDAQDECSIISVEDADGITVAVLKHPKGETWDRRVPSPIIVKSDAEGLAHVQRFFGETDVRGHSPGLAIFDEPISQEPKIAIPDQVRFGLAKRAMKLRLLKDRANGSLSFLGPYNGDTREEQVDRWDDVLNVEGIIDIDALARAFWSVMKEGPGE